MGRKKKIYIFDGFVKRPLTVMPDLIRYPENVEFTRFWLRSRNECAREGAISARWKSVPG
jgi:hypothetical protein